MADINDLFALIESQRASHTGTGNIFFVDPVNGNDTTGDGSKSNPVATVQKAHDDLCTDSNHDIVILVPGAAAGITTLTEDVTLSKRYTFFRGPGRDFLWTRSGNGDTITITGDGIELSGFQLETAATGSGRGIEVNGADFFKATRLWINQTRGDGIRLLDASNAQIIQNTLFESGQSGSGHGIVVDPTGGSCVNTVIRANRCINVAGDGIRIGNGTVNSTSVEANCVWGSSGWGLNIQGGNDTFITADNGFGNNVSGDINDSGTDTVNKVGDTSAPTAAAIADAVWDESNAAHVVAGSTGAALNTLAPTGANAIAFTIDDGASAVPSPRIVVFNAAADTIIGVVTGDINGQGTINLDNATYTIRVMAAGYTLADQTLVVSGAASPTYSMTAFAAPTPADPDNCVVFGNIHDISDIAVLGVVVNITPVVPVVGNGKQIDGTTKTDTTDGTGYFQIEAIKSSIVRVEIPAAGFDEILTVPDAASQDLATWT